MTLAGNRFSALVEKFASGLTVVTQPSPGLVEAVEAGRLEEEETEALLKTYLKPLLDHDVDVIVLGCTHYPFLRSLVEKIAGPGIKILDTGKPVARQVVRVLENKASFPTAGRRERIVLYHRESGESRPGTQAFMAQAGVGSDPGRIKVSFFARRVHEYEQQSRKNTRW